MRALRALSSRFLGSKERELWSAWLKVRLMDRNRSDLSFVHGFTPALPFECQMSGIRSKRAGAARDTVSCLAVQLVSEIRSHLRARHHLRPGSAYCRAPQLRQSIAIRLNVFGELSRSRHDIAP